MRFVKIAVLFFIAVITLITVFSFCLCVRIAWVDRYVLVDDDVKNWFEGIAQMEKSQSYYTNSLFISAMTTRNSIVCDAMFPGECIFPDSLYGYTVINGVKFILIDNNLDKSLPQVFGDTFMKRPLLMWSDYFLEHLNGFSHADSYEERKFHYFKYSDGIWKESNWDETLGEQLKEEDMLWLAEHPDTIDWTCVLPAGFVEKYTPLTENNIPSFIAEWEKWSDQLRCYSNDTLINTIILKVYQDYGLSENTDSSYFYSFNSSIEVMKYAGKYSEYPPLKLADRDSEWSLKMRASERFVYVPSADLKKKILFITPEIDSLLSVFIGGVADNDNDAFDVSKWSSINENRLSFIRNYIPVERGHWSGWYLCTMPIIYDIYMFEDGYMVYLRTSFSQGEIAFFPYNSREKILIDGWIE